MRTVIVAACVLAAPAAAHGQDRVLGLLTLPEVFGGGACDTFTPEDISLFAAPDGTRPVGAIRVDRPWTFQPAGGCEGLLVRVHLTAGGRVSPLPTREFEYEAPAAIVLETRDRWFKVRLADGAAWLHASARDTFLPLEELFTDRLTYLTDAASGRLAASPGAAVDATAPPIVGTRDVRVTEYRWAGGELWTHIELLSHSVCESAGEPAVSARGWIRAHAASGEPAIWFSARGC